MGRFDNLLKGKEKTITIGEEKFNIKPLNSEHIGLFADLDGKDKHNTLLKIVLVSLQTADETITLEDVKELPLNITGEILQYALEINEQI